MADRLSKDWRAQEKLIAKQVGGTRNAGSGAFIRKGDIRADGLLIEAKWTGKKSMTINAAMLEKIVTEALAEGRTPLLQIELNGRCYGLAEWDDILWWLEDWRGK